MSAVPALKFITIEDYLSLEETAEEKHEYYRGEIFAMAGGTIAHNRLVRNALTAIDEFLAGKNCEVFPSDLKVHNEANSLFTYPDISIVCGEPQKWQDRNDTITNPVVIIEVLSESTQLYDRGQKFKLYRSIPSLKEYLLVSSLEYMVEHFTKQAEDAWNFRELSNPEDQLTIESIGFSCPIIELYRNVSFE